MHILKTYRYRLLPTPADLVLFRKFSGCCRFVWNRALTFQKEIYAKEGHYVDYYALNDLLKEWKKNPTVSFLNEVQSQILQQTLIDITQGRNVQNGAGIRHTFRKKHQHNSFRYPQYAKIDTLLNRIYLPKIGWVRFQNTREFEGKLKQVMVSCVHGKWYATLFTSVDIGKPKPISSESIGIDMLAEDVIARLSDGTVVSLPANLGKYEERQRRMQTQLRRMVPHSGHWQKQKMLLQKQLEKIENVCHDHLHKITKDLCERYGVAVIGERVIPQDSIVNADSSGENFTASPLLGKSGGKGLQKALHGLCVQRAKKEFIRQLQYKMQWCGGKVVMVPLGKEEKDISAATLLALAEKEKIPRKGVKK